MMRLCYVKEPWVYFTDDDLTQQWGDDWNDCPHQTNAGPPYGHNARILKVAVDGVEGPPLEPYRSVEEINAVRDYWLYGGDTGICRAGDSLRQVVTAVRRHGGSVYMDGVCFD